MYIYIFYYGIRNATENKKKKPCSSQYYIYFLMFSANVPHQAN